MVTAKEGARLDDVASYDESLFAKCSLWSEQTLAKRPVGTEDGFLMSYYITANWPSWALTSTATMVKWVKFLTPKKSEDIPTCGWGITYSPIGLQRLRLNERIARMDTK